MAEEDCGLFSNLRDNANDSSVVNRLSLVISGRIGPLPLLIFAGCKTFKTVDLF